MVSSTFHNLFFLTDHRLLTPGHVQLLTRHWSVIFLTLCCNGPGVDKPVGERQDQPIIATLNERGQYLLDSYTFRRFESTYYHFGEGFEGEMARHRTHRWLSCSRLVMSLHCLERAVKGQNDAGGVVDEKTVENAICIYCSIDAAFH